MPILDEGTRFLIDTLRARINEVVFGFDGTVATQQLKRVNYYGKVE